MRETTVREKASSQKSRTSSLRKKKAKAQKRPTHKKATRKKAGQRATMKGSATQNKNSAPAKKAPKKKTPKKASRKARKVATRSAAPAAAEPKRKSASLSKLRDFVGSRRKPAVRLSASNADRHVLYEESVQCVESDERFLTRVFKKTNGRDPLSMREDFCGTARLAAHWVTKGKGRTAIGVDIDHDTLEWGKDHHLAALTKAQLDRVTLIEDDVLSVRKPKVDIVCAFNFSYFLFQERPTLVKYFKGIRASLNDGGLLFLDMYGGPEAQSVCKDRRPLKGFTYIWDQASYNPITAEAHCKIHFHFRDGTRLRDAFTYTWRLWSMSEIRDVLSEAGFSGSDIYWEGTDKETGEGNGIFRKVTNPENDPSWIAYIVARR